MVVVAKSPRMVPGSRVVDLRRADEPRTSESVVGRALDDHREHRRAGDEVDQLAVERLAVVLGVVALREALVDHAQLGGDDAAGPCARAADDLADRPRSTASGLAMTKVRFMALES